MFSVDWILAAIASTHQMLPTTLRPPTICVHTCMYAIGHRRNLNVYVCMYVCLSVCMYVNICFYVCLVYRVRVPQETETRHPRLLSNARGHKLSSSRDK